MMTSRRTSSLPCAADMAACLRDPSRKRDLRERIQGTYVELRSKVPKPCTDNISLIKNYSRIMSMLRLEEETVLDMLECFSRGDAESVRRASSRLTCQVSGR